MKDNAIKHENPYDSLRAATVALTEATEQVNARVKLLETELKEIAPGVEAWVPVKDGLRVGYGRIGGHFGVLVEEGGERSAFAEARRALRAEVYPYVRRDLVAALEAAVVELTNAYKGVL